MGRVDSSKRGDCHTMVMCLDNASVVDHGVDSSSVVHGVDSGEWGMSESGVDNWVDSSSVVHRVDSSEWGVGESGVDNGVDSSGADSGVWGVSESGVDKSGISFSLPLVNHVGKSGMAPNARGPV